MQSERSRVQPQPPPSLQPNNFKTAGRFGAKRTNGRMASERDELLLTHSGKLQQLQETIETAEQFSAIHAKEAEQLEQLDELRKQRSPNFSTLFDKNFFRQNL
jgi:flagellar motility protein MotE (MotC chaperone)